MANPLKWAGNKLIGGSGYDPETKHLNVDKANQERELGLEARGQQQQLGGFYQNAIAGKGPSVAQNQLMQGRDEAIKASMAAAAGGRGTNAAIAQRTAIQTAGGLTQQASRDAAILRAQEQQAYAKQYADLTNALRTQDLAARGASISEAQAQLDYYAKLQATKAGLASGDASRGQLGIGLAAGAIGGLFASDIRAKQEIAPIGTAGGMTTMQMMPTQWGPTFAPEQPYAPTQPSPTAGQRFGTALSHLGNGLTSSGEEGQQYSALLSALHKNQSEPEPAQPKDESQNQSGLAGLLTKLSDEKSKQKIAAASQTIEALQNRLADAVTGSPPVASLLPSRPGVASTLKPTVEYGVGRANVERAMNDPAERATMLAAVKGLKGEAKEAAARDWANARARYFENQDAAKADLAALKGAAMPAGPATPAAAKYEAAQAMAGDYRTKLSDARTKTNLSDAEENQFRAFYSKQAGRFGLDPNPDDPGHHYDYRAAWKAGASPDKSGHWPSEFKADDHPRRFLPVGPGGSMVDTRTGDRPDLLQAIRALKGDMPQPSGVPFDQRTGEIVRENPYGNVHPLTNQAAALPSYEYSYKPGFGERTDVRHTGPMAQDLERMPATRSAVVTDPNTGLKGVDTGRLTLANTAMLSDLARLEKEKTAELDALTKKSGKKKKDETDLADLLAALRARGKELPAPGGF